ncbi:RHS repeat domain-containing protein [Akkermansia sp.]
MIALTTFRADQGDITTDPSHRTDGDTTTWLYDTATGLELKKTYADGSCVSKTYNRLNRLKTLTRARGIVTTYQYAPATGELVSVSHSDNTQSWLYSYNHLGQMITVSDALGTREFSYDAYGRSQQETSFGTVESSIQEKYDSFGRSCGYCLMLGTRTVQHSHLDYDHKDVIIRMNLEGLDTPFTWEYDETSGFLNQLSYPNGMIRRNTYHPKLNLLASIGYEDAGTGDRLAGHVYQYDNLMRPIQRRDFWDAATPATTRDFTYNNRSELVEDRIGQDGSFSYQYDNIGNRKISRELEKEISYGANELNQYTNIIQEELDFKPSFDPDGNQTRIRTSTGIWNVCYDANDRPVSFTSEDGRITVTCGYDYQGRRFEKKVAVSGAITSHVYYLYRGYLQVAELNMMNPMPVLEKSYWWDPTEPTATRILMMTRWKQNRKEVEENLYFTHDALKNVTSIFDEQQAQRARYEYAPFGALITAQGDMAQDNRFKFSCECMDDELGLVYYNYRHLNPFDGRWINRDLIQEQDEWNLYAFVRNSSIKHFDLFGLLGYQIGTDDPIITPDAGAGAWNSKGWTTEMVALKGLILNTINVVWIRMPDAANHLRHYLNSSGSDYTIRLQNMIDDVPNAKSLYEKELHTAQIFIETLSDGKYNVTSGSVSTGYNLKKENLNWFYAVGGYKAWGKGTVVVCKDEYTLEFEYKFYDRYNWDGGKQVTILGHVVTDEFMGEFHRQGLAREFDMRGSVKKTVKWKKGQVSQITDGWESEQSGR